MFSYVFLWGSPQQFSSFAYSIWPPKWPLFSFECSTDLSFDRTALIFLYVYQLGLHQQIIQVWLICIFKMATKMADLSSEWYMFVPAILRRLWPLKLWYVWKVSTGDGQNHLRFTSESIKIMICWKCDLIWLIWKKTN